jgi:hypothetical protein
MRPLYHTGTCQKIEIPAPVFEDPLKPLGFILAEVLYAGN